MSRFFIPILVVITSVTALAGEARLIYERPGFVFNEYGARIRPAITEDRQLLGFVVTIGDDSTLTFVRIGDDSVLSITCPKTVVASCTYHGIADTAFFIFGLAVKNQSQTVYRWAFDADFSVLGLDSIASDLVAPDYPVISISESRATGEPVVIVSYFIIHWEQTEPNNYLSEDWDTRTNVYDFQLQQQQLGAYRTFLVPANILGSSWIGFQDYYHWAYYKDYSLPGFPIVETWDVGCHTTLLDSTYTTFWLNSWEDYWYWTAFAGDFDRTTPDDEVIVQYNEHKWQSVVYEVNWADGESFQTACLRPEADSFRTVWKRGFENLLLCHVFEPQRYVAGVKYDSVIAAINYSTGIQVDSVVLDRSLTSFEMFDAGDPPVLNIVGVHADTLLAYEMDTPTDVAGDGDNVSLPSTFTLYQNYPNPFNPSTTIEIDLPHRGHATLFVYNILGRRVATLVDRELPAGHHTITWDGRTDDGNIRASGIYLYRLTTDGFTQTRKMVLVK